MKVDLHEAQYRIEKIEADHDLKIVSVTWVADTGYVVVDLDVESFMRLRDELESDPIVTMDKVGHMKVNELVFRTDCASMFGDYPES